MEAISNRSTIVNSRVSKKREHGTAFGNDLLGATLLSGVAGFVDTAGFLALFGLFTAHVTGDLVSAGIVLAKHWREGTASRLVMIPVFIVTVAVTRLIARCVQRRGSAPLTSLMGLMTGALAVFLVVGVTLKPFARGPDSWAVILMGAAGVVAMGIQNTLMRDALVGFTPTTLMTGNLTQLTIDMVEIALPDPGNTIGTSTRLRCEAVSRLRKFGFPLSGFIVGALLGASLTELIGLASIALPTVLVGAFTLRSWSSRSESPAVVASRYDDFSV